MHRPTTRFTRIVLGGIGAAALAMSARPAHAVDRVWFDTIFGGDGINFSDPFNWSPAGVPNAFDRAIFTAIGGPVQVTGARTIDKLIVGNGVDVDLTITPAGSLFVNAAPAIGIMVGTDENLSRLTLDGDTLETEGAEIGVDGVGELRIENGAGIEIGFPHLLVGADGTLRVIDGTIDCESVEFDPNATFVFDRGQITVDGGTMVGPTVLSIDGVAAGDPATLILTSSASADYANNVYVANLAGRAGTLALAARASLTGDQKLLVGDDGDGEMSVLGAAIADFDGSIRIGNNAAGSGELLVSDAISPADGDRSRVYSRGDGVLSTLEVGLSGMGVLFVQLGGLIESEGETRVGGGTTGFGFVSVAGAQNDASAELRVGDDLWIGANASGDRGDGEVVVYDGGVVTVTGMTAVGPDDRLEIAGGELRTGGMDVDNPDLLGGGLLLSSGAIIVDGGSVELASGALVADGFAPSRPLWRLENGASGTGLDSVATGIAGLGRIEVTSGSTLFAANGNLGLAASGDGEMEVRDPETTVSLATLDIGAGGIGVLTLSDRAELTSTTVRIARAGGTGTLDVTSGSQVTVTGDVEVAADSSTGAGALWLSGSQGGQHSKLTTNGDLLVGAQADGMEAGVSNVTITAGAEIAVAGRTVIGAGEQIAVHGGTLSTTDLTSLNTFGSSGFAFSDGLIIVDGGTLDLAAGQLTIDSPSFPFDPDKLPTWILANGASTTLDALRIGTSTRAAFSVVGGASCLAAVGSVAGLGGSLTVSGTGSQADFGDLDVAEFGTGDVTVSATAELFVGNLTLGDQSGHGTLTVGGSSTLYVDGDASLGGVNGAATGTGTLGVLIGSSAIVVDSLSVHPNGRLELDDESDIATTSLQPAGTIALTLKNDGASGALIESGSGTLALGGAFEVDLGEGFTPVAGGRWSVLSAPDISGAFDSVTLPALTSAAFALVEKPGGLGEILELRVEADSPGDLDLDGFVDFADLSGLLAGWGPCPATGACPGDLDGNDLVGFADLATLLANWG